MVGCNPFPCLAQDIEPAYLVVQAVKFPFPVFLSLLVEPVPEQFESFHILVPRCVSSGEWSPPPPGTGMHTVRRLSSVKVMLSFTSWVLYASPTPCVASLIISPFGLMDTATITQPPLGACSWTTQGLPIYHT